MNRADRRRQARDARRASLPLCPRVVVASLHARDVPAAFVDDWTNLLVSNRELIVDVVSITGSLVAPARNAIAQHFLAGDADWLFTVDDDMSFAPSVLPALLAHVDPVERPIVGALCVKVHRSGDVEPTMYRLALEPHTHLRVVSDWQRGALVRVDATGAACMVVHRSVFERLDAPWFSAGELSGEELGEDVVFCLSARKAGFDVHVASSVGVGHIKPRVFGVGDFDRQQRERALVPTFVVVPVRDAGDPIPVVELGGTVAGIVAIPNSEVPVGVCGAAPTNIPWKWNRGVEWARREALAEGFDRWNVLLVNDDAVFDVSHTVGRLSSALRADPSHAVAYPNVHAIPGDGWVTTRSEEMAGQTLAGFCFMVRGESDVMFDERYPWWYSDAVLEKQVNKAGLKVVCALDVFVEHQHPNESTRGVLLEQARRDEARFAREWNVDPGSLFLARNPDFGLEVQPI